MSRTIRPATRTTNQPITNENAVNAKTVNAKAVAPVTRVPLGNVTNTVTQINPRTGAGLRRAGSAALQPRPTSTTAILPQTALQSKASTTVVPKRTLPTQKVPNVAAPEEQARGSKRSASVFDTFGLGSNTKEAIRTRSSTEAGRAAKKPKLDVMEIEPDVLAYEDIDAQDGDDPRMVSDYVEDIYNYLKEKEREVHVSPRFLTIQADITDKMRTILVDWLVEVHRMFKLLPETLYLTVSILNKFLSIKQVQRSDLQLVGVTSILLASKYEEIYAPEINDIVYVTDNAYTKEQILDCEEGILSSLGFSLNFPSSLHYLRRYSKAASFDTTMHTLCKYLCEVTLLDIKLLKHYPSEIAAGAVYLANTMTNKLPSWTPTLTHYTEYTEAHVRTVAFDMNELLKKLSKTTVKAIWKKYSSSKFEAVAAIPLVGTL